MSIPGERYLELQEALLDEVNDHLREVFREAYDQGYTEDKMLELFRLLQRRDQQRILTEKVRKLIQKRRLENGEKNQKSKKPD